MITIEDYINRITAELAKSRRAEIRTWEPKPLMNKLQAAAHRRGLCWRISLTLTGLMVEAG